MADTRVRLALSLPHSCNATKLSAPCLTVRRSSSGDHTGKETPVPIPNTAVKLSGPMIVPTSAKVGIARFFKNPVGISPRGFCFVYCSAVHRGLRQAWSTRTRDFATLSLSALPRSNMMSLLATDRDIFRALRRRMSHAPQLGRR